MKLTTTDLDRIFHEFAKFENPKTHLIEIEKIIFKRYKLYYNLFSRMFFQVLDKEKTGQLNFLEYLIIIWSFLSTDDDGLASLCFCLFDTER